MAGERERKREREREKGRERKGEREKERTRKREREREKERERERKRERERERNEGEKEIRVRKVLDYPVIDFFSEFFDTLDTIRLQDDEKYAEDFFMNLSQKLTVIKLFTEDKENSFSISLRIIVFKSLQFTLLFLSRELKYRH